MERLKEEACRLRRQYYGDKVYIRGLIEFTNYCRNDCYYAVSAEETSTPAGTV